MKVDIKIKSIVALTIVLLVSLACTIEPEKNLEKAIDVDSTIFNKINPPIVADSIYEKTKDSSSNSIPVEQENMHIENTPRSND